MEPGTGVGHGERNSVLFLSFLLPFLAGASWMAVVHNLERRRSWVGLVCGVTASVKGIVFFLFLDVSGVGCGRLLMAFGKMH